MHDEQAKDAAGASPESTAGAERVPPYAVSPSAQVSPPPAEREPYKPLKGDEKVKAAARGGFRWSGPGLILLVAILLAVYLGPRVGRDIAWNATDARIQRVRAALDEDDRLAALSESYRLVAEGVRKSVVHVKVYRDGAPSVGSETYQVPRQVGNGSGWVYEYRRGDEVEHYIITNFHVVRDEDRTASRIVVVFEDETEQRARVIGGDPKTDVAVLKVRGRLHAAKLARDGQGAFRDVEQGDVVFAFGSPFHFRFSVSQGIVSAKGRKNILREQGKYEDFIQTDAAINPGNSGGPLTNIKGEVVGMNTAIATRDGGSDGLGFAIPVSMVVHVADQLIETGQVTRGYLGVYITSVDRPMARTFGHDGEGVLVERAVPGSPAEARGLQRGDIITHLDGRPVANADVLRGEIAARQPGEAVVLQLVRDGASREVTVKLASLDEERLASEAEDYADSPGRGLKGRRLLRFLGFEAVTAISPELAQVRRMPMVGGVLIQAVRPGSILDNAVSTASPDALPGELISPVQNAVVTHVKGERIRSVSELIAELEKHEPGDMIRMTVWEPGGQVAYRFMRWPLD